MTEFLTRQFEGSVFANHLSLPIDSMIRRLCEAATTRPDQLFEVIKTVTLMIDAAAPTYGLATWTLESDRGALLCWSEGLTNEEIEAAEASIHARLGSQHLSPIVRAGEREFLFVLPGGFRGGNGGAIFGRCVHPLDESRARELSVLADVVRLAQSHAALSALINSTYQPIYQSHVSASALPGMIYTSREMANVARSVERIKDSDSSVLITGESGTGKELIARAIHRLSRRNQREFIPFNCTAVPSELMESILFGHRKGSFTGAMADSEGLIRAAEGGTLFLDEIGDLPLSLQPKLLRFLQEGEVHTLGEKSPRKVNVRVVAATHKNLEACVRSGQFREDLFYRVAALSIHVPPLRERPEDTAALISHFLTHHSRKNDSQILGMTADAIRALQNYKWPGNVRELAAEIERLVLYADENSFITPDQISRRVLPTDAYAALVNDNRPVDLDHMMDDYERRVITETLKRCDCNVAKTADALGLGSRQTLYKKLKRLAIDIGDFLQEEVEPGLQLRASSD